MRSRTQVMLVLDNEVSNAQQLRDLLNADKAYIFRIVHRDNLEWILKNGVHCRSSQVADPNYVNIGSVDLIEKRRTRQIGQPPGGTLEDYVPFYFTPFSPMAYNINTGFWGIRKRRGNEITILVSSLHKLSISEIPFLFTDRHAYLVAAQFFTHLEALDNVDWPLLQTRNFKRDQDDLGKMERYQAEALVHNHCPVSALLGIACYDSASVQTINRLVEQVGVKMKVVAKPEWYFS